MKFIIFGLILIASPIASFALDSCQDNGRLYMPTAEFTIGNKHVLFVGMTHTGPHGYYVRTRQAIEKYIHQNETPVSILTEFFTCQTKTLDVKDGLRINVEQLEALAKNGATSNDIGNVANMISNHACEIDIDGRTKRPAYLVDRNRNGCDELHKNGFDCQWGDLSLPEGKKIWVESGDIEMDKEPLATQVIASMAYRDWDFVDPDKPGQSEKWNTIFDSFILDKRNDQLVQKAIKALEVSDRVILPWGSAHLDGIKSRLESIGFRETSVGSVLYASATDLGKWDEFDRNMKESLTDAAQMAGNCAELAAQPNSNIPNLEQGQEATP